jgi:16S rRNA (guanine527-N7)-methyltransferase
MPAADPVAPRELLDILEEARRQGFIGPGPLDPHLAHSQGFADAVARVRGTTLGAEDRVADLGTGAGLPGLVLAGTFPEAHFTLIEGSTRRADALREAVERCRWQDRIEVVARRAEVAGHEPGLRGTHSVVVSRLFGAPAVTAECAAGLLRLGGLLVVSEPPSTLGRRWLERGLATLGLEFLTVVAGTTGSFAVLRQVARCPDRFPRRTGVPAKRPIF